MCNCGQSVKRESSVKQITKRRTLHNLIIDEILDGSIKFTQQGKRQKSFQINNSDIFTIYKQI